MLMRNETRGKMEQTVFYIHMYRDSDQEFSKLPWAFLTSLYVALVRGRGLHVAPVICVPYNYVYLYGSEHLFEYCL